MTLPSTTHNETTDKTTTHDPLDVSTLAAQVEDILPVIGRRLFTLDPAHPLSDVPQGQLRLCTLLMSTPNPTMSQVADELGISDSAATQLADRLERAGLAERVSAADVTNGSERNRRSRHLRLTQQGRELMLSRRALRQHGTQEALKRLTPEELGTVQAALALLLRASYPVPTLPVSNAPEATEAAEST